jgi:uncharacterized protein YegP (UPF0339 family)
MLDPGFEAYMDKAKFEVYSDEDGRWRWRLKAPNGKIIGNSGGSYSTKEDCEISIGSFLFQLDSSKMYNPC